MKTAAEILSPKVFTMGEKDEQLVTEKDALAAMQEYASQFQSDTGKEPTEETPFYCTCGVPNFLHATACGWHNAALVIDPKTDKEKEWYRKAQEANPIWFTVEPPKAEAGEPSPEITGQEGKAKDILEKYLKIASPFGTATVSTPSVQKAILAAMQEYAQQPAPIRERMAEIAKVIKTKADQLNTANKQNRHVKGAYVDCLVMINQALSAHEALKGGSHE